MSPYTKSKKFNKSNHNRGLILLNTVFVLIIFCLVFFHLIQVNDLISSSYQIRNNTKHFNELKEKNQSLGMEIAQLQSPINLDEIVQSFGMVKTDNIIYLDKEKIVAINR
ncbi:MAG: septum formation initiator family protein [Patescibacteria group bacterium]|nr:septum formation initiator family protein [Patescibacteria group bacterium]